MKSTLRPIHIVKNYVKYAEGSCLFSMGNTRVLCAASVEQKVPPHAEEKQTGWVTAEYAMLPRAGDRRTARNRAASGGRSQEISRLIGRALRAVTDLAQMPGLTITIDCDVIQADGGTRTASINGGVIALAEALKLARRQGQISAWPLKDVVGAVSVGMVNGKPVLDLEYSQDKDAESDCNFVMTSAGRFVEVQGTAEGKTFTEKEFQALMRLAQAGIRQIIRKQLKAIGKMPA